MSETGRIGRDRPETFEPTEHPWVGRTLEGFASASLGRIIAVFAAENGESSGWALVRRGLFGGRRTLVPLVGTDTDGERVRTEILKVTVRSAPDAIDEDPPSRDFRRILREHYRRVERDAQP